MSHSIVFRSIPYLSMMELLTGRRGICKTPLKGVIEERILISMFMAFVLHKRGQSRVATVQMVHNPWFRRRRKCAISACIRTIETTTTVPLCHVPFEGSLAPCRIYCHESCVKISPCRNWRVLQNAAIQPLTSASVSMILLVNFRRE